jgi:hypothetical protein
LWADDCQSQTDNQTYRLKVLPLHAANGPAERSVQAEHPTDSAPLDNPAQRKRSPRREAKRRFRRRQCVALARGMKQ